MTQLSGKFTLEVPSSGFEAPMAYAPKAQTLPCLSLQGHSDPRLRRLVSRRFNPTWPNSNATHTHTLTHTHTVLNFGLYFRYFACCARKNSPKRGRLRSQAGPKKRTMVEVILRIAPTFHPSGIQVRVTTSSRAWCMLSPRPPYSEYWVP